MPIIWATIKQFAETVYRLDKEDRYTILMVAGETGEGKSHFLILFGKAYSHMSKTSFSITGSITWERDEFEKWISGGEGVQFPEYSYIINDELISTMYRRNWMQKEQKKFIEIVNKIRDRHLCIGGAIPYQSDVDIGFKKHVRFIVWIPRGRTLAHVFQKEDNPWNPSPWNEYANMKILRQSKNPSKCIGYVCTIKYDDLTPEDKEEYLKLRNAKRRLNQNADQDEIDRLKKEMTEVDLYADGKKGGYNEQLGFGFRDMAFDKPFGLGGEKHPVNEFNGDNRDNYDFDDVF